MFRNITFNGTDKKEIGAPILRRTNEMIYQFDLQYERNYKIVKVISQREIEFQEYLKQQEALQYHLDNLIKILRLYFKENNYNPNTYYNLFKPRNNKIIIKKRKKRKKRNRPKTAEIKRNKYIFYKITRNNFYFNKFKPYLYPLTNKDRKAFEKKIYTDINLKEKEKNNLYNMTPAQIKKFVDVFGFVPVMFKKEEEEEDEEKDKNAKKKRKNGIFSNYGFIKNKKEKKQITRNRYQIKMGENNKLIRAQSSYNFNNSLKDNNSLINNSKSYNNLKFNKHININTNRENLKLNNKIYLKYINQKVINKNNNFIINHKNNKITFNNRYLNINNYNNIKLNNTSTKSMNNFNLNNTPKTSSLIYENKNYFNNDNNKLNTIKIKKNLNLKNLKKNSFTNRCFKTILQSEVLNKDIQYLNKEYDLTSETFNNKKKEIEKNTLNKQNFLSFIQIYEKDFTPEIKKKLGKKYEHIKESSNGRIQMKKIEFNRKSKSKLNFVQVYNKRREQKRMNRIDFTFNNNDEEKSNLIPFEMRKSLRRIKLKNNKIY